MKAGSKSPVGVDINQLYAINIKAIYSYIRKEQLAFILICAYLFFEYVRPQSMYPAIDIIPWGFLILLLAIVSVPVSGLPRFPAANPLNKLMVLYLMIIMLSSSLSYDPSISWGSFRMFFDWFLIYFLIVYIIDTESRFLVFLLSFLLYSFKMSQFGSMSWALRGFAFEKWGVVGPPGWFGNSGELGIQMAIFTPLSFYFILGLKKHWGKYKLWFFYLFPFTGLMTAIASSSRGALVGIAVAFLWPLMQSRRFLSVSIVFSVVAMGVWHIVPEESKERFQGAGKDDTSLHRMERWEHGWDAMLKHPFLGVGHNVWDGYYPKHYSPTVPGPTLVHNAFVQCGSELGFSGLFTCFALIGGCFLVGRSTRRDALKVENEFVFNVSKGLDSALLGYLASASFVTVQYYPYFWIHLAFVAALRNIVSRQAEFASLNDGAIKKSKAINIKRRKSTV